MSHVQLVQATYEAFGRGDLPTVLAVMDPGIEWREAEGNPYQPSGEAWRGPDAIVENLFMKIVADYDGSFVIHPKTFHDAVTASLSKGATPEPTRPLERTWTPSTATCSPCGTASSSISSSSSTQPRCRT
jgi:ketosteroid isomerase-like protein